MIRCVLEAVEGRLSSPETVEGRLCSLEALEVLEALDVMRHVLL